VKDYGHSHHSVAVALENQKPEQSAESRMTKTNIHTGTLHDPGYDNVINLMDYAATDWQKQVLQSLSETKNARETGRILKLDSSRVSKILRTVKIRAASSGFAPEHDYTRTVPDGYTVKGVSTYYDSEGAVKGQWVKSAADRERMVEIARDMVADICEGVSRLDPLPEPKTKVLTDLLNLYTMTDCHIGMLAWGRESGKDWDLKIAEETLSGCFADMLRRSPESETCVIAQLGDWMHYDSLTPVTPSSGHILDADSRAGKMVSTACRVLRSIVDMALVKHKMVHLLIAEGNHDMFGSLMMRTLFRMVYEKEPRVQMIESENPYYAMQFGSNMLAWHHGHKKGLDASTALYMASVYPKIFGSTEYRVIHFGDKHHRSVKEFAGITLEQHGTLAANDAYATRGGWKSNQYCEAITYHKELGEAGRIRSTPAMIGM